jgi:uncharacterized phage protein (TIGR01671 family)
MNIKLRAWDEQKKIMHYNFEFIRSGIEGNDFIIFKSDKQKLEDKRVFNNPYFAQQLKISLSTNLFDENKKEIYENDIISDNGIIGKVKFDSYGIEFIYKNPEKEHWIEYYIRSWGDMYHPIIIGNIYENPELLNNIIN